MPGEVCSLDGKKPNRAVQDQDGYIYDLDSVAAWAEVAGWVSPHTGRQWKNGLRGEFRAALLVGDGQHRHVTAESLFEAAKGQGEAVSLATVYNTLRAFCDAGLLQEVTVDGSKSYFDTNTHDHPTPPEFEHPPPYATATQPSYKLS